MLKLKVEKEPAIYSNCSLMLDGMSIRKRVEWDVTRKQMVGFVDLGAGPLKEEAGEALVVMAVGLQGRWKVPVCYILINGISAEVQRELILSIMKSLFDIKITVRALVMDGHSTNQRMASLLLGCPLNPEAMLCSFKHPSSASSNVYIFFDACHLLKNLRGAIHYLKEIQTSVGVVRWNDFVCLQKIQEKEGLRAANKLTSNHVNFEKQKMNVRLAAQTLSGSVSAALRYASSVGCEGLVDCKGTADFVSIIDHLFDIFNSRGAFAKGYKSPIRAQNLEDTENFLMHARSVLLSMCDMSGSKVSTGRRKIGVIGFLLNIESLLGLAKELLLGEEPVQKYLLTYKLSQDHLELFFSAVRQRGGWNNNPSAVHFGSAYRALLSHAGVSIAGSSKANCAPQDSTSILNVMDTKSDESVSSITFESALIDHTYSKFEGLGIFVEGILEYIAGWIVRSVSKSVSCQQCAPALVRPVEQCTSSLLTLKNNGGLVVPSISVVRIVRECELVTRSSVNVKKVVSGEWEKMLLPKFMNAMPSDLFPELAEHSLETAEGIETHIYILTKLICQRYLTLRRHHVVRLNNLKLTGVKVRHQLNKTVLFKNQ